MLSPPPNRDATTTALGLPPPEDFRPQRRRSKL